MSLPNWLEFWSSLQEYFLQLFVTEHATKYKEQPVGVGMILTQLRGGGSNAKLNGKSK